jgi:hypothetical protein
MKKLNEKINTKAAIGRGGCEEGFERVFLFSSHNRSKTQIATPPHGQGEHNMLSMSVCIVLVKTAARSSFHGRVLLTT